MTNCKFDELQVGQRITVDVTGSSCLVCGHPFEEYGIPAVYEGHRVDGKVWDTFRLSQLFVCPTCSTVIYRCGLPCEADGAWDESELFAAADARH